MWYTDSVASGMSLSAHPQVMRLRRAVLQIPPKPPVPPGLPLYKYSHQLTRPESTLPQVLIPLNFISFISNTYTKPGGGPPSSSPKVWQLVTARSPLQPAQQRPFIPSALEEGQPLFFHALTHTFRRSGGRSTALNAILLFARQTPPNGHPAKARVVILGRMTLQNPRGDEEAWEFGGAFGDSVSGELSVR
jgi:hypothetical protein